MNFAKTAQRFRQPAVQPPHQRGEGILPGFGTGEVRDVTVRKQPVRSRTFFCQLFRLIRFLFRYPGAAASFTAV